MRPILSRFFEPSPKMVAPMWLLMRCLGVVLSLRAFKVLVMHASYVERTTLLFDYWLFSWLPRPPAAGVYGLLGVTIVSGVALAVTRREEVARGALLVGALSWSYFFFLDKAFFGNLNYLLVCLLWTLVFTRSWRAFSPRAAHEVRPIDLWAVRLLLALVYFYAGVIKLSADWLSGDVLAAFLAISPPPALLAGLLTVRPVLVAMAVGGALFDLLIGPLLCWERTRRRALWIVLGFHLTNFILLDVPEVALVTFMLTGAAFAPPGFAKKVLKYKGMGDGVASSSARRSRRLADGALIAWLVLQVSLPLRPYLPDGEDHRWTHTSQDFSWWLRSTHMRGAIRFDVQIDEAPPFKVDVSKFVDIEEQRAFALDPYLITQFVHHLHARQREAHPHAQSIRVKVTSSAKLNGCKEQQFVRSDLDLTREPIRYTMSEVVHPLDRSTCRSFGELFADRSFPLEESH